MSQLISLSDIKNLRIAHTTTKPWRIESLDFHANGEHLVFNSQDEIIVLTLTPSGIREYPVTVDRYGAVMCRFVDAEHIVHTSNKKNDDLRLLNIGETRNYVRYFPGHESAVISLSVCDKFIASSSLDTSIRLWDARKSESFARQTFKSPPLVAFHPYGELFAVGYDSTTIEVFSIKNFDTSLKKLKFEKIDGVEWKRMKFSDQGQMLMVTTNSSSILIIDLMEGKELHNFRDYSNPDKEHIEGCFAIGSDFVFGGSFEGLIHVWNLKTSFKACSLRSGFEGFCHHVAFNPKFMNLATCGRNSIHLWNEKF